MRKQFGDLPSKPAALFLTPEAPYPLAGGGQMRSASLLEYLAKRFHVDVVVFREPSAPDPALAIPPGLVRDIKVFPALSLKAIPRSRSPQLRRSPVKFLR